MASDVSSGPAVLTPACRPCGSDMVAVTRSAWILSVGGHRAQSSEIVVELNF